jgi:hypothetical protein
MLIGWSRIGYRGYFKYCGDVERNNPIAGISILDGFHWTSIFSGRNAQGKSPSSRLCSQPNSVNSVRLRGRRAVSGWEKKKNLRSKVFTVERDVVMRYIPSRTFTDHIQAWIHKRERLILFDNGYTNLIWLYTVCKAFKFQERHRGQQGFATEAITVKL